jgi:hypothetical protein
MKAEKGQFRNARTSFSALSGESASPIISPHAHFMASPPLNMLLPPARSNPNFRSSKHRIGGGLLPEEFWAKLELDGLVILV